MSSENRLHFSASCSSAAVTSFKDGQSYLESAEYSYVHQNLLSFVDEFGLPHLASALKLTWFRAYSSDIGRWLSRDRLEEHGDSIDNLYTYVLLDPLNKIDPLGHAYQCQDANCSTGGTYGKTAMYCVSGRNICRDCAVKRLGVEDESGAEQEKTLRLFLRR